MLRNRGRPLFACLFSRYGDWMKSPSELLSEQSGRLIVSCQAEAGSAFRDTLAMARFARAPCRAWRPESARMAPRLSGRFGRRLASPSSESGRPNRTTERFLGFPEFYISGVMLRRHQKRVPCDRLHQSSISQISSIRCHQRSPCRIRDRNHPLECNCPPPTNFVLQRWD